MRTVLKFIGFLLAMMAFGVYGQFLQAIFTSAAKANTGIGLVVAAIFYPVAILLPNVFLWRLFWGRGARNVIAYLSGLFIVPKIVSTIDEIDRVISWQHMMNNGILAPNVMHDSFRPYAIASWIMALVWGIVFIECFKRPNSFSAFNHILLIIISVICHIIFSPSVSCIISFLLQNTMLK